MVAQAIAPPSGKLPDRAPHFDYEKGAFAPHQVAQTVDAWLKQEAVAAGKRPGMPKNVYRVPRR